MPRGIIYALSKLSGDAALPDTIQSIGLNFGLDEPLIGVANMATFISFGGLTSTGTLTAGKTLYVFNVDDATMVAGTSGINDLFYFDGNGAAVEIGKAYLTSNVDHPKGVLTVEIVQNIPTGVVSIRPFSVQNWYI